MCEKYKAQHSDSLQIHGGDLWYLTYILLSKKKIVLKFICL